jgi:hypothetical protein
MRRFKTSIAKRAERASYRGISAIPQTKGQPDERGLYDLRPLRFNPLDRATSSMEILTELVNLPDDEKSRAVTAFIDNFHNLTLGGTSSTMRKTPRMDAKEVLRLRNRYRYFWNEYRDAGRGKSVQFMELIGPWPGAHECPVDLNKIGLSENPDLFPMMDFTRSALQMNWKTGQFKIVARGPVDYLTHAVFQNRNRLRTCAGKDCGKLFVAFGPHEKHCSATCKLEAGRKRKRDWFRKNRGKRTKGGGR